MSAVLLSWRCIRPSTDRKIEEREKGERERKREKEREKEREREREKPT